MQTNASCCVIVDMFLINCSVIGSFSVLVVSIVRWRHLKEQVSRVACINTGLFNYIFDSFLMLAKLAVHEEPSSFATTCTVLQVHVLVQLALADLLAALILMTTSVMNKVPTDNSLIICQYSLPLSLVRSRSLQYHCKLIITRVVFQFFNLELVKPVGRFHFAFGVPSSNKHLQWKIRTQNDIFS